MDNSGPESAESRISALRRGYQAEGTPIQTPFTPSEGRGGGPRKAGSTGRRSRGRNARAGFTSEDIIRYASEDIGLWSQRNERMEEDQDRFLLKRKQKSGDTGELQIYLNDPRVIVEKLAGMSSRRAHRIEVPPQHADTAEAAQSIENACRHWHQLVSREWEEALHNPLAYDQSLAAFLRGWVVSRLTLDTESPSFVREELFDAYTVYPQIGQRGIRRVTHQYMSTVGEMADSFKKAKKVLEGHESEEPIQCIGYYENKPPYWCGIIANGEFIKDPAPLGYWPWVIGISKGLFTHSPLGQMDRSDSARHVGEGYLEALRDVLDDMNHFISILANMPARELNPPVVLNTESGEPKDIEMAPGSRTILVQGESWQKIEVGPGMGEFIPLLSTLQDRINKASLPSAMFGEGTSLESGFMSALLMGAAEDNIWPFLKMLEGYHSRRYSKFLEIFEQFWPDSDTGFDYIASAAEESETIEKGQRVWGGQLLPQDIHANGTHLEVHYEDISPQDRVALGHLAALLIEKNVVSMKYGRSKYLNIDDPEKINDEILQERVFLNPKAVDTLTEIALMEGGDMKRTVAWWKAKLEEQQTAQQSGPVPGPGQAPGPAPGPGSLPTNVLPQTNTGAINPVPSDEELMAALQQGPPVDQGIVGGP